jgi:hypothetical protein
MVFTLLSAISEHRGPAKWEMLVCERGAGSGDFSS